MERLRIFLYTSLLAVAGFSTAQASPRVNTLGDNVQLTCSQPATDSIACDFRLIDPAAIREVNISLVSPDLSAGEPAFTQFLIHFLVDANDRQPTMTAIRRHIQTLVRGAAPYHRFGLAVFASDTRELVKPGASADAVLGATAKIKMLAQTTELYRNTLHAVRLLSTSPADRKALFVFSDGLAEDHAYFHEDVVGAANAAGVIIVGMGYPRTVQESVALQSIRRLSEDTGGRYLAAGERRDLPPGFVEDIFQSLGNGGGFTFDLTPAVEAGLSGSYPMAVHFSLERGSASASVPVQVPNATSLAQVAVVQPVTTPSVPQPAPATTSASETSAVLSNTILWGAVAVLSVIVLVMLCLLIILFRRNASTKPVPDYRSPSEEPEPEPEPDSLVGFLEPADDPEVAYAITSTTYRIGRHSSNDLPVPDPSVSRQHAEIRRRGSRFTITDLESMNGVFVNNKQQKHTVLSDDDTIELGDVAFKFKLETTRSLADDATVILKVAPSEFDFDIPLDDDDKDEDEEKIA